MFPSRTISFFTLYLVKERLVVETRSKDSYKKPFDLSSKMRFGGAKRDRTADLLRARQALSQLSYSPKQEPLIGKFGRPGQT